MREIVSSLNNWFPIEIGSNNCCNAISDFEINDVIRFAMPEKSILKSIYIVTNDFTTTTYIGALDFEIEIGAHSI